MKIQADMTVDHLYHNPTTSCRQAKARIARHWHQVLHRVGLVGARWAVALGTQQARQRGPSATSVFTSGPDLDRPESELLTAR